MIEKFTQEELKTGLGQLLLDLRCNWGYEYSERLLEALNLCYLITDNTSDVKKSIDEELESGDYDGRVFRNAELYGYLSTEGNTKRVREWLRKNLTHPEYCIALTEEY